MTKSIVVLLHDRARHYLLKRYCIWFIADYWRKNGYTVKFLFGVSKFVPADLCFVHVDLSVVPDQYLEFANRYPVVVNGSVKDIRKSTFTQHKVTKDSSYPGSVIVKSNLNSAGWPEKVAEMSIGNLLLLKLIRFCDLPYDGFLNQSEYKVYSHVKDVPENYFYDSSYLVEKFLPERDGELYCVNFYKFLGDIHQGVKLWSTNPVITGQGLVKRENIEPNPEIIALRNSLGIDYGKIDYCMRGDKPVLLDVNKTVGLSRDRRTTDEIALIHQRATGIDGYFN